MLQRLCKWQFRRPKVEEAYTSACYAPYNTQPFFLPYTEAGVAFILIWPTRNEKSDPFQDPVVEIPYLLLIIFPCLRLVLSNVERWSIYHLPRVCRWAHGSLWTSVCRDLKSQHPSFLREACMFSLTHTLENSDLWPAETFRCIWMGQKASVDFYNSPPDSGWTRVNFCMNRLRTARLIVTRGELNCETFECHLTERESESNPRMLAREKRGQYMSRRIIR